ncbi:MAG: nucleotidyltransferase family protein [Bacteroidales bacterium]|nr:nucleotidyltransferase family protein [Bacteroidales bacterium]
MTTREALFALIRISVCGKPEIGLDFHDVDWSELLLVASQQGVKGAVWSGIGIQSQCEGMDISVPEKMKWHGSIKKARAGMSRMWETSAEFADNMSPCRCLVLKGLDYARYWPDPLDREFTDLDCWCVGEFDKSNIKAQEIGGNIEEAGYKHNHIRYKGIVVENHKYFTDFADTKQGVKAEKLFKELAGKGIKNIGETKLLSPNENFTALFMLRHAQLHFLAEGIGIKHILDWQYFLQKEEMSIDWDLIYKAMDMMNMRAFADVMTICSKSNFGLKTSVYSAKYNFNDAYIDAFLDDVLDEKPSTADFRLWKKALRIVRRFRRMWKFRALLEEKYIKKVWLTFAYNSFTNRHPSID